jgi:hypothetical protein
MARTSSTKTRSYTWKTSAFYGRLESLSRMDAEVRGLLGKVEHIAGKAPDIARYVVAFLPQYTDHGERHLTNVLKFMEDLAGKKNIQELSALECALAIMAAMTHDLGMVLDEEEKTEVTDSEEVSTTPEGRAWQTFRDGHGLWHRYLRLTPGERATERGRKMFGQLKADYIRHTHSRESGQAGCHRILGWLDQLAPGEAADFYRHKGFSFREGLAHLAMSHGQDITWLPARLAAADSPYAEVRKDPNLAFACGYDRINWPWLSWLLRLADVMDCDASRTPAVLFENIGITDSTSQTEWKKHLSIPQRPRFNQGGDGATLLYDCPCCPDPYTEMALRDIVGWINDEVEKARAQFHANKRHFPKKKLTLELPSKAELRVTERANSYEYLDLHFRLDRAAVMDLLMGEALYGEPDLALRELVQNSLDALHLRDLRVKLQRELKRAGQGEELPVPVVAPDPEIEPLEVQVRWDSGTEGRPWIEIADNGVGMTRDVIERFLTQIGKSYYKSPDFLRERELMKRHGLLCTTISQFGIGFLSAFMLADEIELETRAATKGGGLETGWRVRIHGAHGLIALYPLEPQRISSTGTRVRLALKSGLALEPFDHKRLIKRLRRDFYGLTVEGDRVWPPSENVVEPAWSIGRCVVWPLWPVRLEPTGAKPVLLDAGFHARELLCLDLAALQAKADEWTYPPGSLGDPHWVHWDWVDNSQGPDENPGTGSRIRLTLPWHTEGTVTRHAANEVPGLMRQSELLALTEAQLPGMGRTLVLVNGVLVPEWTEPLARWLELLGGVGAWLWLDLRGPATPRLRADRRAPTRRQEVEGDVRALQERFQKHCAQLGPADGWLRLAIMGLVQLPGTNPTVDPKAWALAARLPRLVDVSLRAGGASAMLVMESAMADNRNIALAPHLHRDFDLALARALPRTLARDLDRLFDFDRSRDREVARARALTRARARIRLPGLDRVKVLARDIARELDLDLDLYFAHLPDHLIPEQLCTGWSAWLGAHLLPELLQPSLERAYPPWCLPGASGPAGDLSLGGPLVLQRSPSTATTWADELDLLVPLTGHPLGRLASHCLRWKTRRESSLLFTLPFLLGDVPSRWRDRADAIAQFIGVDSILAFVPDPAHWDAAFSRIPEADFGDGPVPKFLPEEVWKDSGVTALWDIKGNQVLWGEKFCSREEVRKVGKPLRDWAENPERRQGMHHTRNG